MSVLVSSTWVIRCSLAREMASMKTIMEIIIRLIRTGDGVGDDAQHSPVVIEPATMEWAPSQEGPKLRHKVDPINTVLASAVCFWPMTKLSWIWSFAP
jgi:hypothetical protein